MRRAHPGRAIDFALGLIVRLALLRCQQAVQLLGIFLDRARNRHDCGAAFFDRGVLPRLERGARGGDRFVQFGLAAGGHLADHLFGGRVHNIEHLFGGDHLAADQVLVLGDHVYSSLVEMGGFVSHRMNLARCVAKRNACLAGPCKRIGGQPPLAIALSEAAPMEASAAHLEESPHD